MQNNMRSYSKVFKASDREKDIVRMRLSGEQFTDIGRLFDITPNMVTAIFYKGVATALLCNDQEFIDEIISYEYSKKARYNPSERNLGIIKLYESGMKQKKIAQKYNISAGRVSGIIQNHKRMIREYNQQ